MALKRLKAKFHYVIQL